MHRTAIAAHAHAGRLTLGAIELDNPTVSRVAAEVGSTANSYQILAKLATGGMAEIFLARVQGVAELERYCVLKRILRDRASDVQFVRMFLDEARLAAQLQHANIAQVYDIGKLGDSYFFTMEYVHGQTVRELLHHAQSVDRQLPIASVLTIVAGAAAGLHHAHERRGLDGRPLGIVHRDVSPSNLMVSYEGGVKVVDFGVAKAADRADETKTGTVKGKISYLSPEQCKGRRVDRRSDLFSLGICFWELLTAERLYKRASDFETMNAIVTELAPAPSARRPDVPREIDELVLRLLAKSPDARCQTAEQVVDALEQVAARTGAALSAAALGRFLRELIGPRPEPWLLLAGQREHGDAVTVASEPIPPELAAAQVDAIDVQLSSVRDLGAARVVTESLNSLDAMGALRVDPTLRLGRPLFAPPPPPPPPPPPRMMPGTTELAMPDAGRSRSAPTMDASVILMASADVATASSGEPVAPARRPTGTPVAVVVAEAEAAGPMSGTFPAPGVFAAPSAEPHALPGSAAIPSRRPGRLRHAAAGAALIGVASVVLAMRAAAPRAPVVAGAPAAITVVPILELETSGSARSAVDPGGGGKPADDRHARAAEAPRAAVDAPRSPGPAVRARISARSADLLVRDPPEPLADPIERAFADRSYDKVLAACGAGPVTADHAALCVMAACNLGDEAKARQRLIAVAAASRAALIDQCAQLGVAIAVKQPVDCDADPMACPR